MTRIIYRFYNTSTGKSYIGQTQAKLSNRIHTLLSRNILIAKDVRFYDHLDEMERLYILKYNSLHPNGFNLQSGGFISFNHSLKTRNELVGKIISDDSRERMSISHLGKKSNRAKRVLDMNTGIIFESVKEASIITGVSCTAISMSCRRDNVTLGHISNFRFVDKE
jgi:hypothetical protein